MINLHLPFNYACTQTAGDALMVITLSSLIGQPFQILSADAKVVLRGILTNLHQTIPLRGLPTGIYTLYVGHTEKLYLRFVRE